ncbi:MAG: MFS transporter [Pseudomonadales bacterium]|nr:MFS transporter [Pseudomonadales bacterium]
MSLSSYKNAWLLTLSNALAFTATPMVLLIGSLVGADLANDAALATLPLAMMVIGAAMGVVPATLMMKRVGRKRALLFYVGLCIGACLVGSHSLSIKSFALFNSACFFLGASNAAFQQMRFAAMESVSAHKSATAAAMIMSGGIVAAILGPELALYGRPYTAIEYQGSFYLVSMCLGLAAFTLLFYRPEPMAESDKRQPVRPLSQMIQNPNLCLAIFSSVVGFFVMSFIMTGTPISMHNHHGYSLEDTKWVIQSHLTAMFLPSLIVPYLVSRIGIRKLMVVGLILFSTTIAVGSVDTSVWGFWIQLVLLGVGWNFLFLSGTALLPSTYRQGEEFKAQALNDSVVFSLQAVAALTAGVAIAYLSWQSILLICLVPVVLMFVLLFKTK